MTWNETKQATGPAIGWHWYRDTPTSEPRRVKIFDVAGLKYVWPMESGQDQPFTVRVEHCTGEFMGPAEE